MIPHEDMRNGRKKIDRKTFVEEKVYTVLYKDRSNAELFGPAVLFALEDNAEPVSGHWIKGDFYSQLPGHHLFEDYKDASVCISRVHEDGSMILHEGQAHDKYEALSAERSAEAKKADESFSSLSKSKGGAERMLQIMRAIADGSAAANDAPPAEVVCDSSGNGSGESSDEAPARPLSLFSRSAPTKVKPSAKQASTAPAMSTRSSSAYDAASPVSFTAAADAISTLSDASDGHMPLDRLAQLLNEPTTLPSLQTASC